MLTEVTCYGWVVAVMCKRLDWMQIKPALSIECLFFLYSYTYWWTTGVLKHLPLPFDEGRNYICSLPHSVSHKKF